MENSESKVKLYIASSLDDTPDIAADIGHEDTRRPRIDSDAGQIHGKRDRTDNSPCLGINDIQ